MAILRPISALQAQRDNHTIKPLRRVEVKLSAHEIERREFLVRAAKVKVLPTVGKPLRAQKWYQPDYRVATPKGLVLKSDAVRGVCKRFGVQ